MVGVIRRGKAQHVSVEEETTALASPEGVAVDAHDAGHSAAIGVEGRGGIVRFDLHDQVPLVVELDHAGVVIEHRDQPVDLPADLLGRPHNISLEQTVHHRLMTLLIAVLQ